MTILFCEQGGRKYCLKNHKNVFYTNFILTIFLELPFIKNALYVSKYTIVGVILFSVVVLCYKLFQCEALDLRNNSIYATSRLQLVFLLTTDIKHLGSENL